MLIDKGAQGRGRCECAFRDYRFNAEFCVQLFRLQRQRMYQVTHVQYRGPLFDDGFLNVARIEVHQRHTGIFHLGGADAVGGVVNLVRQTFIAAWLEISRIFNSWFPLLQFWRALFRFWLILVCRNAILAGCICFMVNARLFLIRQAWRGSGKYL